MTTEQANTQRECTAVRWIVEVTNRSLKCNKYLARTLCVQSVPHLLQDTRIAAAIHNRFGPRIHAYNDDGSVVSRIVDRTGLQNNLQRFVEDKGLTRKTVEFEAMDGNSIPEFPRIDLDGLKAMIGSYQIDLSVSYYGDHVFGHGGFEIQVGKEASFRIQDFLPFNISVQQPLLLRVKLTSRHSRNKVYQAYVLCDLAIQNVQAIVGFCYQCLQGARTVSPCAHVSSMIWFLGHGRHLETIKTPSEFLNRHFPRGPAVAESDDE